MDADKSLWLQLGVQYILRQWQHYWLRTALSILGVALGVAVLVAIQLANQTTLDRFKLNVSLVAGQTDASVVPVADTLLDEAILQTLSRIWPLGGEYAPVVQGRAVLLPPSTSITAANVKPASGALAGKPLEILGVDMATDYAFRPLRFVEAPLDPQAIFQKNRVYIPQKLALNYRLKLGSPLTVLIQDQAIPLTVAGITTNEGPALAYDGHMLLMDIANAQVLLRQVGQLNRVDVQWPDSVSRSTVTTTIQLPATATLITPGMQQEQTAAMVRAFQTNLTALSLIALMVAGFLIYNTLSLAMLRRRNDVATLRTLGAGTVALFSWFTAELILFGAIGSVLGVGIGMVLAIQTVAAVSGTVGVLYTGMPVSGVLINPTVLITSFGFGIATTLLAGLIPVGMTLQLPPASATRRWSEERHQPIWGYAIASVIALAATAWASQQPPVDGFPLFGHASSFLLVLGVAAAIPVGLPLLLKGVTIFWHGLFLGLKKVPGAASLATLLPVAMHQLHALRGRTSVAIASLMVALAMAISLTIMIHSFRETVQAWVAQSITADLWIEAEGYNVGTKRQLNPALVNTIRQLPGVATVDAFLERPLQYQGQTTRLAVGDLNVFREYGNLRFLSGEPSATVVNRAITQNGVLLTEPFASRFHLAVGDTLHLPTPQGDVQFPVVGIYRDYTSEQGYVILNREQYQRYFSDGNALTGIAVYGLPGHKVGDIRDAILAALPPQVRLSVLTRQALRAEIFRIFDNTFAITYALHAIAITVALLGIFITLMALVMATRREFAILSWLGATPLTLASIILLQGATLCGLGTVLGGAVGLGLSQFLVGVINKQSFGWTVDYHIPVVALLGLMATMLGAGIITASIPARWAAQPLAPQALQEESS